MKKEVLKTGVEFLDDYFNQLSQDSTIDEDLKVNLSDLWEQKRLYTKTYLSKVLEQLIKDKSE